MYRVYRINIQVIFSQPSFCREAAKRSLGISSQGLNNRLYSKYNIWGCSFINIFELFKIVVYSDRARAYAVKIPINYRPSTSTCKLSKVSLQSYYYILRIIVALISYHARGHQAVP